jgi:O-antigen/teichoic acid export membrane protein
LIYTFALLIPTLYAAVSGIFMTAIVRWYEGGDKERVGRAVGLAMRAYIAVGGALLLGLYLGARPIITWLARPEYAFEGVEVVALAVGTGGYLFGLFQILTRLFDLAKRTWTISAIWVLAMMLNLALNAYWIPEHGALGAAVATAVSYGLTMALAWVLRPREVSVLTAPTQTLVYLLGLVGLAFGARALVGGDAGLVTLFLVASLAGALALLWSQLCGLIRLADIRRELARHAETGP